MAAGTISATPKQPLAPNVSLLNSARTHLRDMLAHNFFAHTNSSNPTQNPAAAILGRMTAAGYTAPIWYAENQAWQGTSGTPNVTQMINTEFQGLFTDTGVAGRGHRVNMLNNIAKEIGSGEAAGLFNPGNPSHLFHSVLVTQDLGRAGNSFLTGVIYRDPNHNGVYDIGEELPGVTVSATNMATGNVYQTTTGMSGGYSLPLSKGTYTVRASGRGLPAAQQKIVTIGALNVLADFLQRA